MRDDDLTKTFDAMFAEPLKLWEQLVPASAKQGELGEWAAALQTMQALWLDFAQDQATKLAGKAPAIRKRILLRFAELINQHKDELALLETRSRLVYYAIFCAVLSALLVCLVVASAFVGALLATDLARMVAALFVLSMCAMLAALSLFLREIYLAVRAGTHVICRA